MQFFVRLLALIFVSVSLYSSSRAQLSCVDCDNFLHKNRTIVFDIISTKNLTGHWITKFVFKKESPQLPKNWKFSVEQNADYYGGLERFHLKGLLVVPPSIPSGYTLYPGLGYYKYYDKLPGGWDKAYSTCAKEGTHLAIVNSEAEFNVIRSISKEESVFLGFHDRVKEGEFVTIYGQPLSSTGFSLWLPKQPDNAGGKEHCGSYHPAGGLNDLPCDVAFPFVCEYDLSWTE